MPKKKVKKVSTKDKRLAIDQMRNIRKQPLTVAEKLAK